MPYHDGRLLDKFCAIDLESPPLFNCIIYHICHINDDEVILTLLDVILTSICGRGRSSPSALCPEDSLPGDLLQIFISRLVCNISTKPVVINR